MLNLIMITIILMSLIKNRVLKFVIEDLNLKLMSF